MRKLFWLAVGIFAGMELKKRIENSPEAMAKYEELTARVRELRDTAFDSFNERSSELASKKKPASKKPAAKKPVAKAKPRKSAPSSKPAA